MMWEYKNFEDYLQEKHLEEEPCILDDDAPEAFDDWICNMDCEGLIEWGDKYAKIYIDRLKTIEEVKSRLNYGIKQGYYDEEQAFNILLMPVNKQADWLALEEARSDLAYQQQKEGI